MNTTKSTRRHAKLDKSIFGTHDCRIYYVNINLHHQYGISATESHLREMSPMAKSKLGETDVSQANMSQVRINIRLNFYNFYNIFITGFLMK